MPAFGSSDAQKRAEGFFPAQGLWNEQQYRDWLDRMKQFGYNAEEWGPWAVDYFQNLATHGTGTPQDIKNYGDWIMPGRQPVIDARTGRLNQIGSSFDETAGGMQERWGQLGQGIGQNYDVIQGDINDVFGQVGRRGEAVHGDVQGNIRDVYGGARGNVRDVFGNLRAGSEGTFGNLADYTGGLYGGLQDRSGERFGGLQDRSTGRYGEMQGRSAGTFGGLQGRSTGRFGELGTRAGGIYGGLRGDVDTTIAGLRAGNEGAYGTAEETLETLNPAGDAAAARATRAFAPQMASTMGRLRAAGIDANSPEAAAVISRVEAQRGRAAEDAYTDAARNYVDRSTSLTLGEEGINRDLGMAGLGQRLGLGQAEEEIGRGLGLGELENYQQLGLGQLQNYLGLSENELQNYQQLGLGEMENYQGLGERAGGIQRDLALQRLMNGQGLSREQLGMDTNLALEGGQQSRNEMLRNLQMTTGLDLDRLQQTTGNRNRAFEQGWNWTQGANELDRNIWGQRADLGREQNAEDLWRYGFDVMQPFQAGNAYLTEQERIKSGAAGPVLNAGNAAAGQASNAANTALNFGNTAAQNFGQTIQTEAPNSGWATRLLGGIAGTALTGGFGGAAGLPQWAKGIGGVLTGQQGTGGGYPGGFPGQYGGYGPYSYPGSSMPYGSGANPYNPMIFSNQPYQQPVNYVQTGAGFNQPLQPWQMPQQSPRAPGVNYDIVPPGYKLRGR